MTPKTEENRPQTTDRQLPADRKVTLPKLWIGRLIGNLFILFIIIFMAVAVLVVRSNLVTRQLSSLSDYFFGLTSSLGFTVDDVIVYGRDKTPVEEIYNIVNTRRGDNILRLDIRQIKDDLEQLPWVKAATVERSYLPNILKISLKERKISSLWQINNRFYPVDTEGSVIRADFVPAHPLLLIIGRGAPEHLNGLLSVIAADGNKVYPRVKAANFISGRRWNLILDDIENGITVKLPAENMPAAWQKLLKLDKTRGLLKRKLTIIDLRFPEKILIKPRKNASDTEHLRLAPGLESNI